MKTFPYIVAVSISVLAIGCAGYMLQSPIAPSGNLRLPTAQQLLDACYAEKATGKPSDKSPDCIAWFAFNQACQVAALGQALNPLVATINPVAGSLLGVAGAINTATCKIQGFYDAPVASPTPIPVK